MQTYTSIELTPRGLRAVSRAIPDFDNRDTLIVRLLRAGICRSDLKEVRGTRAIRRDFGHELLGIVEGPTNGEAISAGSLVTFDPHVRIERTSGFAEFMVARGSPAALNAAFPLLPAGIGADRAVFVEPTACGYHAVARLSQCMVATGHGGLRGATVAVLGAGLAGTIQSLVLRSLGSLPKLFNRNVGRLNMLTQRGLFSSSDLAPLESIPSAMFDAIIISISFITFPVLKMALTMVKPNGVVLLFGGTGPGVSCEQFSEDIDTLRRQEHLTAVYHDGKAVWLAGTHGATSHDFVEAIAFLSGHEAAFPVERLIVEHVRLEQLVQRMENLAHDDTGYVGKIVVDIVIDDDLPLSCKTLSAH